MRKRGLNSLTSSNSIRDSYDPQIALAMNRMANIKRPGGVEMDPSKQSSNLDIRVTRNRRQPSNSSANLGLVADTPNFNRSD